ncbi:MAG: lipoyl(octanoyl) transferase LipB [Flavobacteriales bacterium]|nr:lipoyl(octanoyl) transferase LipB [Bacteroidota bacterium]MCB9240067.1 lipoyl(octanoyl) transferase LipB [Flavobacteriales bacterium]
MIDVQNRGLLAYQQAWDLQKNVVAQRIAGTIADQLILCEHPHVYTFGKSADRSNLLISPDFLEAIGAQSFEIERGGDITYHGPGQLVGYPILNLHLRQMGVKKYVDLLEDSIIQTVAQFGIEATRIDGLTGIWIDDVIPRKIAAIGIKISRGVTMHGFALNVGTDLSYYNHIVPCGITDKGVTSMAKETGGILGVDEVIPTYIQCFSAVFEGISA